MSCTLIGVCRHVHAYACEQGQAYLVGLGWLELFIVSKEPQSCGGEGTSGKVGH